MSGRGGRERGNRGSKMGSVLTAENLTWGLNSRAVRSQPELKSDAQPTEPPWHPASFNFKYKVFIVEFDLFLKFNKVLLNSFVK